MTVPSRSPRHRHLIFAMEQLIIGENGTNRVYVTITHVSGALQCSPTFAREANSTKRNAMDVGVLLVFPNSEHHFDVYSCVRIICSS